MRNDEEWEKLRTLSALLSFAQVIDLIYTKLEYQLK